MKGEMTEVLIPISGRQQTEPNLSIFKAFLACALIITLGFIIVRYENKIYDLEYRLATLEIESIRIEHNEMKSRTKRSPGGGHSGHNTIPWVERSGEGDPQLNPDYLSLLRAQSERARSQDDQMYSQQSSSRQSVRSGGRRQRGPSAQQLVRNDEDETFFTQGRNYVRPSGLREIYERLPPASNEVGYQTPNLETRAFGPAADNIGTYAPLQQVGSGANQVRARVVRYGDDGSKEEAAAVAAHYVADVSNFTTNENPRLRNSNGIFQIWRPADWMSSTQNFALDKINGALTVRKDGIYHIYAQIHYHDVQENSFIVEVNDVPLVQCTTTQESNSCFTGGIAHLKPNDKIVIKNVGIDRFSIYKPEKSFFGLMKIGEAA